MRGREEPGLPVGIESGREGRTRATSGDREWEGAKSQGYQWR